MIAIVLAAGYATRLYPLTENFPKPLLPVNEKPILNWLLDDLEEQEEITGYVIVSNHKFIGCLLYTSPSPRDVEESRMPSSA